MWCLVEKATGEIEPVGVPSSFPADSAYVVGFATRQDLLDVIDPVWDTHEAKEVEFEY